MFAGACGVILTLFLDDSCFFESVIFDKVFHSAHANDS